MPEILSPELEVDFILQSSVSAASVFPALTREHGRVNTQVGTWAGSSRAVNKYIHTAVQASPPSISRTLFIL